MGFYGIEVGRRGCSPQPRILYPRAAHKRDTTRLLRFCAVVDKLGSDGHACACLFLFAQTRELSGDIVDRPKQLCYTKVIMENLSVGQYNKPPNLTVTSYKVPSFQQRGNRYSMYWTLEKEILLIKYFEQHRYLWDTNHILFHKREPRIQSFAELVQLLGIDEGTIRQRWSSMRSQFCREERKVSLCPTYVPTWDHYTALQFLRKPYDESMDSPNALGIEPEGDGDSLPGDLDTKQNEPTPSRTGGFDWNNLVRQIELRRDSEKNELEGENPDGAMPLDLKSESEFSQYAQAQPPTPSQLVRKHKTPRQRRWTPGYNKKYQEIANVASASMNQSCGYIPQPESPRLPSENEAFTQYIANVLERFPPAKQRRCRNELLCVLLQYDSRDDDEVEKK